MVGGQAAPLPPKPVVYELPLTTALAPLRARGRAVKGPA